MPVYTILKPIGRDGQLHYPAHAMPGASGTIEMDAIDAAPLLKSRALAERPAAYSAEPPRGEYSESRVSAAERNALIQTLDEAE